jgi:hypothetical protein
MYYYSKMSLIYLPVVFFAGYSFYHYPGTSFVSLIWFVIGITLNLKEELDEGPKGSKEKNDLYFWFILSLLGYLFPVQVIVSIVSALVGLAINYLSLFNENKKFFKKFNKELEVIHKEPEVIHKEPEVIHKEPEVIHKEPEVIHKVMG